MSPQKSARPMAAKGITVEQGSHCGKIFTTVTISPETNQPMEVFIRFGKAGGCGSAIADGLARLASYALRSGMDPSEAVKALSGIGCHHGNQTCMQAVSESLRFVMLALATGRDINELIEDADLAEANAAQ
jgi:hypothetical protein